ncbi:hypothetical protein BDN72DRAFT_842893 [Pluteus cervinus]|uniref:Uncharacterized protein n=1 Tax=Pluteus cervinus TaxID=181527 RepID=A0ACD3AQG4_9AGAR|nr:hypothetical protein BDN72DRAFT_842893 [Pluteus cervinus]
MPGEEADPVDVGRSTSKIPTETVTTSPNELGGAFVLKFSNLDLKKLTIRYVRENVKSQLKRDVLDRLPPEKLVKEVQEGLATFRPLQLRGEPSTTTEAASTTSLPDNWNEAIAADSSDLTPLPSEMESDWNESEDEDEPTEEFEDEDEVMEFESEEEMPRRAPRRLGDEDESMDVESEEEMPRRVRPRLDFPDSEEFDADNEGVAAAVLEGNHQQHDSRKNRDKRHRAHYLEHKRGKLMTPHTVNHWTDEDVPMRFQGSNEMATPSSSGGGVKLDSPIPASDADSPVVPGAPPTADKRNQKRIRGAGHEDKKREARRERRAASGRTRKVRMHEKLIREAQVLRNDQLDLETDALVSETGWRGLEPTGLSKKRIRNLWVKKKINPYLKDFHLARCTDPDRALILVDKLYRAFLLRSKTPAFFVDKGVGKEFVQENLKFAKSVCDIVKPTKKNGVRGPHEPLIVGPHREYSSEPKNTAFHQKYRKETEALANSPAMRSVCGHIKDLMKVAFPWVLKRYQDNIKWHKEHHGIQPLFPPFWNYCFNALYVGQDRVHCLPHSDSKNIVGICAVMVYELEGTDFDFTRKSWLCIWDAGVIVELRPWKVVLYPSSLMYHFNVDIDEIHVVTTDGSLPTHANSTPIVEDRACGRGSVVFFNQATMFQSSETDSSTLEEAISKGHSGKRDFAADIQQSFPTMTTS